MTSRRLDDAEPLVAPFYFVALLLVATPTIDFVTSVLPLRPSNIEWRFASVGLLSGFLLTPLLGILIAMCTAAMAGQARVQRGLAILNAVAAVLSLVILLMFLLDIVQLRSVVQAEAKASFEGAAVKAVLKHVSFLIAAGWLARRGFLASRWAREGTKRPAAAIIIG
ncbi:MAG: hypothetical protein H7066_10220 [Cytophagaceae bacterium]|nr:hypothetical protein [Gemmatimonadaceae bacterium]